MARFHKKIMINGLVLILKQLISHLLMVIFLARLPMVYIFRKLLVWRVGD